MELSLNECIALALENNLELDVERLNPQIALAGVESAWGAYDPVIELSANYDDAIRPRDVETTRAIGLATTSSTGQQYNASLGGELPTGTQYSFSLSGNQDESSVNDFQPQVNAEAGLRLTQPLLRGAGSAVNLGNLRISRRDKLAADADLELQISQLVTDVYNAYYDLIFRRADLDSQRESLGLAETLLGQNQERLRLGTMNALDVTQARSDTASRRAALYTAERTLHESENILKRLIFRDLETRLDQVPLPAGTPPPPTLDDPVINLGNALEHRADLRRERVRLEQDGIRVQVAKNALLPTVDLEGTYRALGQDDSFSGGFSNASELEAREFTVGVLFRMPLGARAEKGDYQSARLRREQQVLNLKALEQDIVVQVDNAVQAVRTSRLRYAAAQEASQLARETFVAEQDRLQAGATTTFVVNQLQRDYTVARTNELSALASWRQSVAELSRVEGTALIANGIELVEPPVAPKLIPPRLVKKDPSIADPAPATPPAPPKKRRPAPAPIYKR
jgi:outer membrane protein